MSVQSKILQVMFKVDYLQKDGKVAFGGTQYRYLSEEKITTEIRKAMLEVGVIMYPVKMEITNRTDDKTEIICTYRIQDAETGEYIEVQSIGEGQDKGDKKVYKAMTGAFKYAQRESFMIPTGDDPDKTPSEEMNQDETKKEEQKQTKKQDALITENQLKRLFAISKGKEELAKTVLGKYGYSSSKEIKKADYNKICEEIEKGA